MEVAICAVVCNFPDDEISLFINTVTNIRSRFELILETHSSNLQNSKQYSAENLYLIGDRIEPRKLIVLSVRTSANSPGSDRCEPWKASDGYHARRVNKLNE